MVTWESEFKLTPKFHIEQIPLPADKPITSGARSSQALPDGGIAMANQFDPYRGYETTTLHQLDTVEASGSYLPQSILSGSNQSGQASPFASDFQQLLGEGSEPDPLFFIETWTLGTLAAVENFRQRQPVQQRQPMQPDRTPESRGDWGPTYAPSQSFFHPNAFNWSVFVSVHTAIPDPTISTPSQQHSAQWNPSIPDSLSDQDETLPMTLDRAYKVLRVSPTSSVSEIKAAHRQLVVEWHPDRLQEKSDEVRRYATGKMAAINQAYSLLRNHLLQPSA